MAEAVNDGEQPPQRKKMLIVLSVVLVLLIGGGAAAYFFIGSGDNAAVSTADNAAANDTVVANPVAYVNIPQPFIFNVIGDKRDRMVQIKVQLMVRGSEDEGLARYHSPLIESVLLSTFASATVEQLRSSTGRGELRDKATDDIQTALSQTVGQPVIEKVLFTDFVIQ